MVAVNREMKVKIMRQGIPAHNRPVKKRRSITSVITPKEIAMFALKLTQIGNSVGVVLPKELLAKLHIEKGDTVYATESPDGVRLTPFDPAFEKQMDAARKIMKARRNVLHELAK
jgi:putative addiction module antidote